jgi:hypothetical protein
VRSAGASDIQAGGGDLRGDRAGGRAGELGDAAGGVDGGTGEVVEAQPLDRQRPVGVRGDEVETTAGEAAHHHLRGAQAQRQVAVDGGHERGRRGARDHGRQRRQRVDVEPLAGEFEVDAAAAAVGGPPGEGAGQRAPIVRHRQVRQVDAAGRGAHVGGEVEPARRGGAGGGVPPPAGEHARLLGRHPHATVEARRACGREVAGERQRRASREYRVQGIDAPAARLRRRREPHVLHDAAPDDHRRRVERQAPGQRRRGSRRERRSEPRQHLLRRRRRVGRGPGHAVELDLAGRQRRRETGPRCERNLQDAGEADGTVRRAVRDREVLHREGAGVEPETPLAAGRLFGRRLGPLAGLRQDANGR